VAVADELAISDLDFAAHCDDAGAALDRQTLETVVVVVGVLRLDVDGAAIRGIVNDKIGVAADGDGSLARVKAKEFCGASAGAIDETFEVDAVALDAVSVKKIDAILDAGNAVRDGSEIVFAQELLFEIKGTVIGADGVDETKREAIPERVLIRLGAQRRRHDVLHAFDAGAFGQRLVEEEMRKDGLDTKANTTLASGERSVESFLAGEMNDVAGGTRVFEESGETAGPFGLDGFWAARLVPFGAGFAFGEELLLQAHDQFRVFAVRGDDDTEFLGKSQGLKHLGVVNTEEILVSEEDFEGSSTVGDDLAELRFGFAAEFGDRHVEGVVAGGIAGGFGFPEIVAGEGVVVSIRAAHFDVGGGAADEGGNAGGFVCVLGKGSHERKIDVDVRVDEAGEDELGGGVDDFGAWRRVEMFTDARDGFIFDVDIAGDAGADGDDVAVTDEERHGE